MPQLDSPKALSALAGKLSSDDENLRLAIVETLRESYAPVGTDILKAALDDGSWRIRREAFEELESRNVRLGVVPSARGLVRAPEIAEARRSRPRTQPPK